MKQDDIFKGHGLEIQLAEKADFLKVRETLTRIGKDDTPNTNCLIQTCHIFHKRGRYSIMHYNELHAFDGKDVVVTEEDVDFRNLTVFLLTEWDLVDITIDLAPIRAKIDQLDGFKVLSFDEKKDWTLQTRYDIGRKS